MNEFDFLANYYDRMAACVFADHLQKAKEENLDQIKSGNRVLILGGGTGNVLEKIRGRDIEIDYVESSNKMIKLSQQRRHEFKVNYHHVQFESFSIKREYDVVVANFFFDLFTQGNLEIVVSKVQKSLSANGKLLVADFEKQEDLRYKLMLKAMHVFFKLFAGLKSKSLNEIDRVVRESGFQLESEKTFSDGFIFSRVYRPY